MLEELFVIEHGTPVFHYSPSSVENSTNTALSSGFLSAIQSFTQETRASKLDSFNTDDEIFLFMDLQNHEVELVGVFQKSLDESEAISFLKKVRRELLHAEFIQPEQRHQDNHVEKRKFRSFLDNLIITSFDKQQQLAYLKEIFEAHQQITLAFLVNTNQKEVITNYANPKSLFSQSLIDNYFLFFSAINNGIQKLNLGENFSMINIISSKYHLSTYYSTNTASLLLGTIIELDRVKDLAIKLNYQSSIEAPKIENSNYHLITSATLTEDGKIVDVEGKDLGMTSEIFLATMINNISRFFEKTTARKFSKCRIYTDEKFKTVLELERINGSESFQIFVRKF